MSYPTDTSVELKSAFQREFKVVFPEKNAEIKVQCDGATVKSVSTTGAAHEVTFTALPGKTYIVLQSDASTEIEEVFVNPTNYAKPVWGTSPIAEPYPYVSNGSFSGLAV